MLWIGITGPMGSGKSTVSAKLRDRGYPVIDADRTVHELMKPGGEVEREILSAFGQADRRELGRLVFAQPQELRKLESILHPKVRDAVDQQRSRLEAAGHQVAFYDVPLLFEKSMEGLFDHVIVVTAPEDLRRLRIQVRSGLSDAEFNQRNAAQLAPEVKEQRASFVVQNKGTLAELDNEIERCVKALGLPSPPATNA